jgi:hypothetical protein
MALSDIAGWVAPAATMVAAMMTAANLGARVTGWGFALFTLGSLGWILVGLEEGQTGLVITNGVLTVINAIGIWRWLGRQAHYEALGEAAEAAGRRPTADPVIPATGIVGRKIIDTHGKTAGEAVEPIIDCHSAAIKQVIVRIGGVGGVGEHLVALPILRLAFECGAIRTTLSLAEINVLPHLDPNTATPAIA